MTAITKKPRAQRRADDLLKKAATAAAVAYPLPDAPFLTGTGNHEWHAIRHADAEWAARRRGKDPVVYAVCGQLAQLTSAWPVYGENWPHGLRRCPECAWTVAGVAGDLDGQMQALIPSAADHTILARLIPDPLIAVTAAAMLTEAATSGHADYEFDHPGTIHLLAAITRHAPVILTPEGCAEGSCEHYPDDYEPDSGQAWECSRPEASVACAQCSLQAGPWAGEWEGQYLSECTIPAPCPVLTALAENAAKILDDARRDKKWRVDWEAEQAAKAAAQVTVMTDLEVMASLTALWSGSGWERLEISQVNGRYGGYCVPGSGSAVETADALLESTCPDVITQLATLLSAAGWQRLEIVGHPLTGHAGGWCERADGSGIKLRHIPELHHEIGSGKATP